MQAELKFEDALLQLEQIVDDLERGEPELSAALAKYEQGVRLLAQCHGVLDQAERSVALLTGVDEAGNPVTEPFDPAPERDTPPDPRKRLVEPSGDGGNPLIPF